MSEAPPSPEQTAQAVEAVRTLREEIGRALVGQQEVVSQVLAAFLAGGHVLLEGVPGLGKTLLVLALSRAFGGKPGPVSVTRSAQESLSSNPTTQIEPG